MRIAICDDEKNAQCEISSLINQYSLNKNTDMSVDIYDSGEKLLSSQPDYDIIIMDYKMAEIDGIEASRQLRKNNNDCTIIFISAYPSVAPDTFEVNTFRFITKPIDSSKLFKALDDYFTKIESNNLLVLKNNDGMWKIKMSDIIYAEAHRKHTVIRTADKTFEVCMQLKEIEAQLPKSKFIRSHKSYVVGFNHILNHTNDEILFDNNEKADIGKHYAADFKSAFSDYIIRYNKGLER